MQPLCHCLSFKPKILDQSVEALELRSGSENYGRKAANPSVLDQRTPSDLIREWVAVRVRKMRRTSNDLQQGKCDAETYDQRRGADRHHGKSPFGMLFDIRVHVYLRGKAGFVPKAARTNTVRHRATSSYFSMVWRASACPQSRHSKVCLTADFEVAIMYMPHLGHGGRRGCFGMGVG
jgi:hypothetical protein